MAVQKIQLTEDGLLALQNELATLKTDKRKEIADKLKEAISYGDLSENSEYQDARDQQADVELRISTLEDQLQNYEIVEAKHEGKSLSVNIGNQVKIIDVTEGKKDGEEQIFDVVGSTEVDLFSTPQKISNLSPIGRALIGKKVGDIAQDDPNNSDENKRIPSAPAGSFAYKILEIK